MQSKTTQLTRLVIEHSPSAVAMFDNNMRYVCHSQNWLQHLGLGPSPIVGLCHYDLFPELPERWRKIHERCLAGETIRSDEDVFIRYDGKTEWVKWEVTPYFDENNIIMGIIVFSEVITAQKEAEIKLKDELVWLSYLNESVLRLWNINSVQKGLEEILQTAMKLSNTDKGYIQLLDFRKQALFIKYQKGFDEQFLEYCKITVPESNTLCSLAFNRRQQLVLEDIERDANLSHHVALARRNNFRSVQSIPLLNRLGMPIAVLSVHSPYPNHFDLVGLKRMQLYVHFASGFLENKKQQSDLKEANVKLEKQVFKRTKELSNALQREKDNAEIKSRFFSMASHEFRTPLSVIVSSADLAIRYVDKGHHDKQLHHIERIKKSARYLTEMLNDSMVSDKIESGIINTEKANSNIKIAVEEVIFELKELCKKDQVINLFHEGLLFFNTDKKIVKNILLNIVSNAIKYSSHNIYVTIKVSSSKMLLTIKDSGIGIPKSEQKHLFSRFFRASNTTGINGMGLGLHGVYHYLKALNGKIKVNSQTNIGTIVQISIPSGN